tara:strand:+ start:848 stop:1102 length:255 start_codon:yes stop_codon:yes gene_type:complete
MDMSSQNYLEAMDQLNEKFKEVEYLKKKMEEQNTQLKKELITCYGCIRIIDNLIEEDNDIDLNIKMMCDILRQHLSGFFNESFF